MSLIKKLTSKNKQDYESAASHIVSNADVEAFKELVSQDNFLFDFIKNNVAQRLEKAVNADNYLNLIKFLPYYSPSYVDFIAKTLADFSDDNLNFQMLSILESGSNEERAYCAKYFSFVKNPAASSLLKKFVYSDYEPLSLNSAEALAFQGDRDCYNDALLKLSSDDDFEILSAVKFLVAFGDKSAVPSLFNAMKHSSLSESIAAEIPYLDNIFNLLQTDTDNALYLINLLISGLGEVTSLSQVFDYQLYDVLACLADNLSFKEAVILLNATDKFNTLTENDEYLYDEDKNTKNEIFDIKKSLNSIDKNYLISLAKEELREDSSLVFTAVDFVNDEEKLLSLVYSSNQTLVLKVLSALKLMGKLNLVDKNEIVSKISDENIKTIIMAL